MESLQVGAQRRAGSRRHSRGRNPLLAPLIALPAAAFIALVYVGYVLWPRWPHPAVPPDAPAIPLTIAGVTFNVPPAAVRVPLQRRPGTHERIDLAFQWPTLEPPGSPLKPPAAAAVKNVPAVQRLFVTIAAAADTPAPHQRILTIYPRYTVAEALAGPADLTTLPFREGTPYAGEDLIYDTTAPGFIVRCTRNGIGATPGTCFYERRIGAADLLFRFPRDWLDDWRAVASRIEQLIARLTRS